MIKAPPNGSYPNWRPLGIERAGSYELLPLDGAKVTVWDSHCFPSYALSPWMNAPSAFSGSLKNNSRGGKSPFIKWGTLTLDTSIKISLASHVHLVEVNVVFHFKFLVYRSIFAAQMRLTVNALRLNVSIRYNELTSATEMVFLTETLVARCQKSDILYLLRSTLVLFITLWALTTYNRAG